MLGETSCLWNDSVNDIDISIALKIHYYRYKNTSLWFSRNKLYAENVSFEHLNTFLLLFHRSCITLNLNEIHDSPQEKEIYHVITLCTTFMPSRQFCSCLTNLALKKGSIMPSRMHHFYAITPIILLFHESHLEKWPFTPSR